MGKTPFSFTSDPIQGVLLTARCEEGKKPAATVTGLVSRGPLTRKDDPALTLRCTACHRTWMCQDAGGSQAFTLRWLAARLAAALEVTPEEIFKGVK
jgi:hypothetical protein